MDGWDEYQVHGLGREDLEGILAMIKGAKLPERRQFHRLKTQIEKILEL